MTLSQVRNRMDELEFNGMLPLVEDTLARLQKGELSGIETLDVLLEAEWRYRRDRAAKTRISRSKIRKGAALDEFDMSFNRGISKADLRSLAQLEWCKDGKPLILIGPTGAGKTYLARAFGLLACEMGMTVLFISFTEFMETLPICRASNSYLKFRDRLTRPDLLILDDLGMRKFTSQEAEDLRDIIEQRSYGKSTLITTQLPIKHWGEVIGDEIILDALVDRIKSPGIEITMESADSFRKHTKKGRK